MSIAQQLYQLQEVDLKLGNNEQALARITQELGENQAVLRAQTKLKQEHQKLEELQHQQHSVEWEIEDITTKLKTAETKLYGGTITSSKELTNLQNEVNSLKAKRDRLEDKALDIMEQTEQLEAGIATLSQELKVIEAEWQRQQQQLSRDLEQTKVALSELKAQREAILTNIEPQIVDLYRQLRSTKGTAVSRVEQGICTSCRISLSTANLQQVRSGSLVQCNNCGRILFLA